MRLLSLVFCLILGSVLASSIGHAQWGMGAYGLMSQCPYNYEVAGGSVDEIDTLNEIETDIRDLKDKQKDLKSDISRLERNIEKHKAALTATLGVKADTVITHIEGRHACSGYNGCDPAQPDKGFSHDEFTNEEWIKYCDSKSPGNVNESLCLEQAKAGGGSNKCRLAAGGLEANVKDKDRKQAELEALEAQLDALNEQKRTVRREASKAIRDAQKEALEGGCLECMLGGNGQVYKPRRPTGWEILGGVAAGAIGAGIGYLGANQAMRTNAQLGFPTNPANGFGWPMGMMLGSMAIYGAINGGMNGAYGCNGGMNGMYGPGGLMGYPMGMYPGFPGGGMWMPGGMPMMGMMGGMPMGGMPMSGYPMGMGMMPMSGMPMSGYPMGMGMMPMTGMPMSGYPMGMGMMPMTGMPMSGYPMGMGGMPMSGMPMSGYPMGMGMMPMSGMPMSGYPMGMGGMPMGGVMGGFDGGLGAMQMQQQMMQMQMQQYQVLMEQQRRTQENMFARQRVVSGLQQEMYSLMFRLQQAQMGVGLGVDLSLPSAYPNSYGGYPQGGYPGGGYPNPGYPPGPYPGGGYPGSYYPQQNYPGTYNPNFPGPGNYYPNNPGSVIPQRGPNVR
jgi:hypothetical protein